MHALCMQYACTRGTARQRGRASVSVQARKQRFRCHHVLALTHIPQAWCSRQRRRSKGLAFKPMAASMLREAQRQHNTHKNLPPYCQHNACDGEPKGLRAWAEQVHAVREHDLTSEQAVIKTQAHPLYLLLKAAGAWCMHAAMDASRVRASGQQLGFRTSHFATVLAVTSDASYANRRCLRIDHV